MQERRTTIRVPRECRIQYCSSSDLLPRDGYLMNLSEQGASILMREPHAQQEQVTISFSLPGEGEPVTATGLVRWSAPKGWKSRWHASGLSWLPLEESARYRLHRWIYAGTQHAGMRPPSRASLKRALRTVALTAATALGLLGVLWAILLSQENRGLHHEVQRRTMTIVRLEQQGEQLRGALDAANTSLTATVTDISRLEQQAALVEGQVDAFRKELERLQGLYEQTRSDREQLMQRVMELDRERQVLSEQLGSKSSAQLQSAMEQAITHVIAQRQASSTARGNRGYLLRDGHRSPRSGAGPWIWVHEPEAMH